MTSYFLDFRVMPAVEAWLLIVGLYNILLLCHYLLPFRIIRMSYFQSKLSFMFMTAIMINSNKYLNISFYASQKFIVNVDS